jgi:hypothetical protein
MVVMPTRFPLYSAYLGHDKLHDKLMMTYTQRGKVVMRPQ